jgi:probable phosphoglycerate mutase
VSPQGQPDRLVDVDPDSLTREELIGIVRELQTALAARLTPAAVSRPKGDVAAVPNVDYTLVFDGGSINNPGRGYGSYAIAAPTGQIAARTLDFGDGVTNNQAEFRALIAGLEDLLGRLGTDAASKTLAVRGDSQLVIRGLTGEWRVKHAGLQSLYQQARDLLQRFGSVNLAWQPRARSVRVLGH